MLDPEAPDFPLSSRESLRFFVLLAGGLLVGVQLVAGRVEESPVTFSPRVRVVALSTEVVLVAVFVALGSTEGVLVALGTLAAIFPEPVAAGF